MTTTQTTKRQRYDGYGITELRRLAREAKIANRTNMDGWTLLRSLRKHWRAERVAAEQAVLKAAQPDALLRHKSSGTIVRVTSVVRPSDNRSHDGALVFRARYVDYGEGELFGAWTKRGGVEYAEYLNECDDRRAESGSITWHMLWQYEAIETES